MKWAFSTANKVKASITLLLLVAVVFFSNYRLKKLSGRVVESVQTIYDDRLIVQDLIFSYIRILDNHESLVSQESRDQNKNKVKEEVEALNLHYSKTVLTDKEERVFNSFTHNMNVLLESDLVDEEALIKEMKSELQILEDIQMTEAKSQMSIIHEANGSQELGFYLETAILIILLFIIQVLVMSGESIRKVANQQRLNLN